MWRVLYLLPNKDYWSRPVTAAHVTSLLLGAELDGILLLVALRQALGAVVSVSCPC